VDLYLADACARLDPGALTIFEKRYLPVAKRAVERLKVTPLAGDEAIAELREKLFVARPGQKPQIAQYSGRGSLQAWVRSVVVHAAMRADRDVARRSALSDVPEQAEPLTPELVHLKSKYQEEFQAALVEAVNGLSDRDRNVLRQRYLDGLNIDALGVLYGVHRATAARWVSDASEALLDAVSKRLAKRLGLQKGELEGMINMARSGLDLTLSRIFRKE
jgi:RNA polymerase sigma-70 factor (ECF subfamily)